MRSPARTYADVAVDAPTGRPARDATFTYAIPDGLAGRLRPGHIVRVPFGRRQVHGVVVALRYRSPVERTRDIVGLVADAPQLPIEAIATARWMSKRYMAPFVECLRAMLPPGALARSEPRYRRTHGTPNAAGLPMAERKVLASFGRSRELAVSTIRSRARLEDDSTLHGTLARLVEAGLLARRATATTMVAARTKKQVRLVVDIETDRDAGVASLRRNPRADALAFLRRPDVPGSTPEALCKAVDCRPRHLRALESEGWIDLTPSDRLVQSCVDEDGAAALARTTLARAPAQARLLGHLAASATGVHAADASSAAGVTRSALDGLLARGLARTVDVPGAVSLRVGRGHARLAEAQIRGVAAHVSALDWLAACGGLASWPDVRQQTGATKRVLDDLVRAGLVVVTDRQVWRDPLAGRAQAQDRAPTLTSDQQDAWATVRRYLEPSAGAVGTGPATMGRRARAVLVHGVTGSGKTELYLRAIEHVLGQGRRAIVLVPEIALTPQTVARFAGRFPGRVGVWHSELSAGERRDTWYRARAGELDIVVGSRSAVFAPLPRLGLIVIDEEHGDAFKQGNTPRYHARDTALYRASIARAVVLMGSATPSVETYWAAREGRYGLVELPRRVVASGEGSEWADLPPVAVVDMRSELRAGNTSMFSRTLHHALTETLAAGEQAILFLNRRGTSTFVSCRACGYVASCPECQVPLVWHGARGALVCHHCNRREAAPLMCPSCGSPKIRYFGAGTQAVEDEVRRRFPDAVVLRWDADTTGARGAHEAILARFAGGGADILIGTQMIAKGLDLPRVTLVGVVAADTSLNLPDIWSRERTFQVLAQVAGRAGRSAMGGRVVMQTYRPDEPAVAAAAAHDYVGFFEQEIAFRRMHRYPPFMRLVRIERIASSGATAEADTTSLARRLRAAIDRLGLRDTDVIGPAPAFFRFERGRERWHVIVRAADPNALLGDETFGPGWRLDVDPVSVL